MRSNAAALVACIALACAACGSGAADGPGTLSAKPSSSSGGEYARYAGLAGAKRTATLLADARSQGGVLDIYTSNTDLQALVDGFHKLYPTIMVRPFRADSETVLQRVSQETQAGRTANDIIDTDDLQLQALSRQGVLQPYAGPAMAGLRPEAIFKDWIAERFNAFVIGWNTKLVKPGQQPKSFKELAGPKWKGKLALEVSDSDWYAALSTYLVQKQGMSTDQAQHLIQGIAANAKVVKGHTVMGQLLSAGQFPVGVDIYSHTVDDAAVKGAPVAWRPAVGPVIERPNGVALMKDAKHPAAALLWADFVLGPGQKLISQSHRIPAAKSGPGIVDPVPDGTEVYNVPLDILDKDSKTWSDRYDTLLRHYAKN